MSALARLGLAVLEKHSSFIKWFLVLLLCLFLCFVKSEVYSNIVLPQYHLGPYTQGAQLCSVSMDNNKDSKAYDDMFQTEVVT